MTKKQKKAAARIGAAAALLILLYFVPAPFPWGLFLYAVPYLVVGHDVLGKAWHGIVNRQLFDENFLMAVATLGAFLLGEYTEAAAVMLFYQVGELFQGLAVGQSRKSIAALMDIRPDSATLVLPDGSTRILSPEAVPVGSLILVRPGERIPLDGVVQEGEGQLDTAALTGESLPAEVTVGSAVASGCISLNGVLHIQTTKAFGESTVAKILELVENASEKKARSEAFITRFARLYTPAVCFGALALALLPPLALLAQGHAPAWGMWVYRALTFLVISCPCALVISIPLSFFGGLGGASRRGILIKGASYLETLASCRTVAFDKTGTLTRGEFRVGAVHAVSLAEDELLELAALAESYSSHPIAGSLRAALPAPPAPSRVHEAREEAGRGVRALVDGREVLAGKAAWMREEGLAPQEPAEPGTAVHVAADGVYLGFILVSDSVKPGAREALAALEKAGVERTVLLTGDRRAAAESAAREVGVGEVRAELLPQDKVQAVEELLAQKAPGTALAFVGDGINDAPVLARADVGIAMGALGSDAAIEAADVVLMDDDLAKLPLALTISRRTMRIVRENIALAIGVKLACLALGAMGLANMWLAVFADVGVMILAVLNAARALSTKHL